jgi:hypothetical protein
VTPFPSSHVWFIPCWGHANKKVEICYARFYFAPLAGAVRTSFIRSTEDRHPSLFGLLAFQKKKSPFDLVFRDPGNIILFLKETP